jgi:hypothetical protein
MSTRRPSPEAMEEIGLLALRYIEFHRWATDWRRASHREGARRDAVRALARLRGYYQRAGATDPRGWPKKTTQTLRTIGRLFENYPDSPPPSDFPGLEEDVYALVDAASERSRAAGAGSSPDELSDVARRILGILVRLKAFGPESHTTLGAIAEDPVERIGNRDSQHFRRAVALLKDLRLIKTATGPRGGVWLTPEGKKRGRSNLR